jgi:hypothetical protein
MGAMIKPMIDQMYGRANAQSTHIGGNRTTVLLFRFFPFSVHILSFNSSDLPNSCAEARCLSSSRSCFSCRDFFGIFSSSRSRCYFCFCFCTNWLCCSETKAPSSRYPPWRAWLFTASTSGSVRKRLPLCVFFSLKIVLQWRSKGDRDKTFAVHRGIERSCYA